jgi:hypothetical protein
MAQPVGGSPAQHSGRDWIVSIERLSPPTKHIFHDEINRSRREALLRTAGDREDDGSRVEYGRRGRQFVKIAGELPGIHQIGKQAAGDTHRLA